jgi:peptide/nickel transport system permease protein
MHQRTTSFLRYVAIRIAGLLVVMWLIATAVFVLLRLIPGDPVRLIAGLDVVDPQVLQAMRTQMGLDRPVAEQYVLWLGNVAQGNLGLSIRSRIPVSELVFRALPVTLQLGMLALIVGIIISLPAGLFAARARGRPSDLFMTSGAPIGLSIPSFVLALVAIYVFSVRLRLLPSFGYANIFEDPLGALRTMAMPAITLGLVTAGRLVRLLRRSLIDELVEDYVRTARAKGVSESRVFLGHALHNAMIPYVTATGIEAGILLSGAVITENIFAIPGMGRLMVTNIYTRDYPVVQGAILVVAAVYVTVNLAVDLVYAWLDPRISV